MSVHVTFPNGFTASIVEEYDGTTELVVLRRGTRAHDTGIGTLQWLDGAGLIAALMAVQALPSE